MRMFGSSKNTSFPRPPGGVGGGKPPSRGGGGNSNRSGGGGGGGGGNATKSPPSGGNSGMSAAQAENRIQHCRQAVAQLQEMLRMDYSADLCPMLDILVQEARDEIGHLQSAGEACLAEGRLDLVEQLTTMASDLEDVQRKAEVWKRGGSGGGGAAAPNSFMTDDERMARELHAQFQEEERAASNQGTPATTNRSHRSNQEEEDERFARELQAADQGPVPEPAPFPSAGLGGMAGVDRSSEGSDPGRGGRKKDKKKKRDKEDPFGSESFGAPPEAAGAFGAGGGWPGGPAADVGAGIAGAFQADFGAFPGAAEDKWGDRSPPSFPMSTGGGAGDFGAFGGSGGGFPSESKPAAPPFRGADDFPGGDSGPGGFPSGNSPHGDFGAFPSADVNLAPPESPMALPHSASQDSWGHSSVGKHGWGSQAAGETVTMHIQRPYSEIADDIEGFTADFVRDIAKAMGIAQHRIRVQGVRPS